MEYKEESEAQEVTSRKRVKATPQSHYDHYVEVIDLLDKEIERKKKSGESGIRSIQKIRKLTEVMKREVTDIAKAKKVKDVFSTRKRNNSGMTVRYHITPQLAKFLQIDPDETVTRTEILRAFTVYVKLDPEETREDFLKWEYLNPGGKRNLQVKDDKHYIKPDATLLKLFKFKAGQDKSKVRFIGMQGMFSHHLTEKVDVEEVGEEEVPEEEEQEEVQVEEDEVEEDE